MTTPEDIKTRVNQTFESIESIEAVKVSPFFKDKTMQRIFADKEEKKPLFESWFAPKWQFATLVVIIALNVFALSTTNSSNYQDAVDNFAQEYDLKTDLEDDLFN
jgi:hypothetical protein